MIPHYSVDNYTNDPLLDNNHQHLSHTFLRLYQETLPAGIGFARRLCQTWREREAAAQDIIQDASLVACQKFDGTLDPVGFQRWFFGIVRKVYCNHMRMRQKHDLVETRSEYDEEIGIQRYADIGNSTVLYVMELREALSLLDDVDRKALLMFTLGGFSCGELKGLFGDSEERVWQHLSRARRRMRKFLLDEADHPASLKLSDDVVEEAFRLMDDLVVAANKSP